MEIRRAFLFEKTDMSRTVKSLLIIFTVLIVDQILKIWIKTHLSIGDEIIVFKDWFILHFVENNGMAFGFEFNGNYGKLFLSVFRMVAVVAIGWYLFKLTRQKNVPMGFIVCISLIFAGAIGNIIDSLFYGMIFNHSYGQVATLFPAEGGYSSFLHGRVVDMLYFPLLEGRYPAWIPKIGGNPFIFFRPVFNIADSAITVGIFSILIFYRGYFNKKEERGEMSEQEVPAVEENE